jgi:cyclic pyranopterin phosphate synthase
MTTNGDRLVEQADALAAAGLSSVTVSLDSLDRDRFRIITRGGDLDRVLVGIDAAIEAGLRPVKLNAVALRGFNDDELAGLARFAWDRDCVPRFIELMPMAGGGLFAPGEFMSASDVRDTVASDLGVVLDDDDGDGVRGWGPASYWRAREGPYSGRRLGTIGAISENFCASCNRLRVSATGQLHACLARDEHGDLRAALRSGDPDRLGEVVREVLTAKQDGHDFRLDGSGGPHKTMVSIGG